MKITIAQLIQPGGVTKNLSSARCWILLVAVLFALTTVSSRAQQITGAIVGTVKDTQGAVVPAATVKATNVDTGLSRSTTTANDGAYRIQYLPVGTYNVEVDAPGFKKFLQENLVLAVDQTQALNVTLAVGASSETVTVSASSTSRGYPTATLGRTVQPAEIIGLPLVNRNAYAELSLTPGVQSNSASGATNPAQQSQRHAQLSSSACRRRRSWSMAALTAAFPWSAFTWMAAAT